MAEPVPSRAPVARFFLGKRDGQYAKKNYHSGNHADETGWAQDHDDDRLRLSLCPPRGQRRCGRHSGGRLPRGGVFGLRQHPQRYHGRNDLSHQGRCARESPCPAGCRHAFHVLSGQHRRGPPQLRQNAPGGRRPGRQDRGGREHITHHQVGHVHRYPGHGPHRPDPPVHPPHGRVQGTGPQGTGRKDYG